MAKPSVTSQYLQICRDLGCQPMPEVLTALTAGSKNCTLTSPAETLTEGQILALCAILGLTAFEDFSLLNLNLTINAWATIADALAKCRFLHRLCFKDCGFRDGQGVAMFSRAIASTEVQTLEFINTKMGDEVISGLTDGPLLKSEKLGTLRLAGCGVTDSGAMRLARCIEAIGMHCSVRALDLTGNRIGDAGACALAAMLTNEGASSSVALNSLDLEGNQITDAGALALCKAAKAALMLQRLNLSANLLTDSTMHSMADTIRFNTGTLREVALSGCKAREDAAVALIKTATKNTTLTLLDIRGVPLGQEGVANLCLLLRYTTSLHTLRCDVASAEGAHAIAQTMSNNKSLQHLVLGGPVPETVVTTLSEILAMNQVRHLGGTPVASSPHIHAWIEGATDAYRGAPNRSTSPTPALFPSPRSEAGGSTYSHVTHKTARTNRTHKTATSYMSFGGFTDISRRTVMIGSSPMRISTSLAAGGAAEKAAQIFRAHDQNQDNHLNKQEMLQALQEIGVLNGLKAKQIGRFVDGEFKKADWDKDGRVSLQDFLSYYERLAYHKSQMEREGRIKSLAKLNKQMVPPGAESNAALRKVFKHYSRLSVGQGRVYLTQEGPHTTQPQLNSAQFHRLCQDACFTEPDGRLSNTTLDVIFFRYRSPATRKLAWADFIAALAAAAYEMGMQFEDILNVLGCNKANNATPPDTRRESMSESAYGAEGLGTDPSFDLTGVPLATVHEGQEGKGKGAAQAKAKLGAKKTSQPNGSVASRNSSRSRPVPGGPLTTNPLYESHEHHPLGHGGPAQSSFRLSGARPGSPGPVGRAGGGGMQSGPVADIALVEAVRLDMEGQLHAMEERLERQMAGVMARSGSTVSAAAAGGMHASADALVGAKLRQLEGQVTGVASRQEELDKVGSQMGDLQNILTRLAGEIARMKTSGAGGGVSGAAVAGLGEDVKALHGSVTEVKERVEAVKLDVAGLTGRVDALQAQMARQQAGGSAGGAEAVAAVEKKLSERQARYEGALMQVAKQVDALDQRLREEQESNMKTLEALMAAVPGVVQQRK